MSSNKALPTDPAKLARLSDQVLLENYSPLEPNTPVAQELKRRWKEQAVVAFHENGTVAAAESATNMTELIAGEDPLEMIYVDGQLTKLYPVGVAPSKMRPEDPLTRNKTLRGVDEMSIPHNVAFKGISQEARQFIRVALDMSGQPGVPNLMSPLELRQVMDLARAGLDGLKSTFPQVARRYGELARANQLPPLLIEKGGSQPGAVPFASAPTAAPAAPVAASRPIYDRYQIDELVEAFLASFAEYDFAEVCQLGLNEGWDEVTRSDVPLRPRVRLLIDYAIKNGKLIPLVGAARQKNPGNQRLARIATDLGVPDPLPAKPTYWDGKAQGLLADRLRGAYNRDELRAKYTQQFTGRLEDNADGETYTAQVNNLVWWAKRTGKIEILASWVNWG